jgi:hypothetical protein
MRREEKTGEEAVPQSHLSVFAACSVEVATPAPIPALSPKPLDDSSLIFSLAPDSSVPLLCSSPSVDQGVVSACQRMSGRKTCKVLRGHKHRKAGSAG